MQADKAIRLLCAVLISIPILGIREIGTFSRSDVNGDQRVDVLDLQSIIAKTIQNDSKGTAAGGGAAASDNVLGLQRALREVQLGRHSREIPRSKPGVPDSCVFSYQTGRMADLVDREFETASIVFLPPVLSEPGEHVERCIIPTTAGRYLFILTPNAPPFSA